MKIKTNVRAGLRDSGTAVPSPSRCSGIVLPLGRGPGAKSA